MEKQLDLNSQYNFVEKEANEILGCFKRDPKNRNEGSSSRKALLRPVSIWPTVWAFMCSKEYVKIGDVQKRDTGIIHKVKEMPGGEKTGRDKRLYLSSCHYAQ